MRRILTGPALYFSGLAQSTVRGWNAFFFRPADPTPLGLIRVAAGLLAFWSLLVYGLDFHDFFGPDGWADADAVNAVQGLRLPHAWSFWFYVPDPLARPVWLLGLAVLLMFSAGLFSRVTAVLAWVIVVSTVRRLPVTLFGFDQIISTLLLYLAVSGASGQAVSLDRFLGRWRRARVEAAERHRKGRATFTMTSGVPSSSVSANLGLRLIQLHLCLIYGMAGFAKLQGRAWWDGMAIWGTVAAGEFRLVDLTWLAAAPWVLNAMTHASLLLEIGYPVLVWVRPLRPMVVGAAIGLHVGVGLVLGLGEFGLAMIAANLAFFSGFWLRSLVTGRDASGQPAGRLLFDGACPRCRASTAVIVAADPDRLVELIDLTAVDVATIDPRLTRDACMKAMQLVRADGRIDAGFDAVATLGRWLPIFWPAGLIAAVPGVSLAGRRVYNLIAASRPRDVACNDEVCGLHARPAPARSTTPSATDGDPSRRT